MKILLENISKLSKKHEQLAKVSGSNYNVFNVINITTNEVRLHSKFISELLNPEGSHGQRDIFLQLFIEKFNISMNTRSAKVKDEKYIGKKTETEGGFLDIYITDNRANTIIIENKIYAPDQENQLLRYFNFNKDNILYLTLFGDEPSKNSYGNLEIDKDFKLLSYKNDIIEWLIDCRKEAVEYPLLREGISHYINLIKILTGQSSNHIMNTEIRDYITSSSENLKNASLIEKSMINAKIKIQWNFWKELKEQLIKNKIELVENKSVKWQNVSNYYKKSRNRDIYFGLWSKIFEKDEITIHFGIEIENEIYFGFTIERNGKGGISLDEKNKEYREITLNINENYTSSKHWLGWRNLDNRLDFRAFNSKAIFDLADNKKRIKQIENIVTQIIKDIETLKAKI